jgi:polar amino acid transport system substrate-binding protein
MLGFPEKEAGMGLSLHACLAAWAIFFSVIGPARAQEAPTLVVGVEEQDYLPAYGWRDGRFEGAAREILDAFAADRGLRLEYRALPVKRLFASLVHHEIDLKFPDNPDWETKVKAGPRLRRG